MPTEAILVSLTRTDNAALKSIQQRTRHDTEPAAISAAIHFYYDLLTVELFGRRIFIRDEYGNDQPYNPHSPLAFPPVTAAIEADYANTPMRNKWRIIELSLTHETVKLLHLIPSLSRHTNNDSIVHAALMTYDEVARIAALGRPMFVRDLNSNVWPYSPHIPIRALLHREPQKPPLRHKSPDTPFAP